MKMSFALLNSLFISLVFLSGCSGGDNVDGLDFVESDEAKIAFAESSVTCENPSDCPSFVGGLISYQETTTTDDWGYTQEKFHIGVCSMQLIAPNRILTNRHCIPSNIAYKGASCIGKIYLKFPKNSEHEAESIHCERVVDLSPKYAEGNIAVLDWAILELKASSKRPVVKQNKNGVPLDQKVKAYPVYYSSSSVFRDGTSHTVADGIVKATECTPNISTSFGIYHHKENPIFIANRCDNNIIGGNSGSGLLNQQNELIGVISFGLTEDFFRYEYSEKKSPVYLRQTITGGSNLHCIDALNTEQSSMCYFEEESISDLVMLGLGVYSLQSLEENYAYLKKQVEEENLSKVYLDYAEAPAEMLDLMLFSDSAFKSLPKDLVRASLYDSMETVIPHFPSCVSKQAPDYFEEKLSFVDSSESTEFRMNSDAEITYEYENVKVARYMLSYSKRGSMYDVNFVRASASAVREMKQKEKSLQSSKDLCDSSILSTFYCSRYKDEKREFENWKKSLNISAEVLKNEELLKDGSSNFSKQIPICE